MPTRRSPSLPSAAPPADPVDPVDGVRRAVLDAAVRVAAEVGPDAVSMRDIARQAGVSHQAPYHWFGDRAGVFAAIAQEGFERLERELAAIGDDELRDHGPIGATIRRYVHFALGHVGEFRVMFRSELSGITTHVATRAAGDRCYDAVAKVMARAADGGLGVDDIVVLVWAQAHGLATLAIDGPLAGKMPPGRTLDDVMETATARLRRR